jgi:molecular chaperone GrpE (heat shock protein)
MLSLLAVTLIYTEEEERMDKMLKKMEDANRSQLEALRGQQADIHQLSNALVGQTAEIIKSRVEKAIEEFMVSGDNVEKTVADAVARKILLSLREESPKTYANRK